MIMASNSPFSIAFTTVFVMPSADISGFKSYVATFGEGGAGETVALIGSTGYVEIAINKGNASRTLSATRGAEVILAVTPA